MAASEDKLNTLHERLTDLFLEMLDAEEEGDEDSIPLPAATLKTMTSFLKDNEITCQGSTTNIGTLGERLKKKKKLSLVEPVAHIH